MGRSPCDKNSFDADARIYRLVSISFNTERWESTYLFNCCCIDDHELDNIMRIISARTLDEH